MFFKSQLALTLLFIISEERLICPSSFFRLFVNGFNCSKFLIVDMFKRFKLKSCIFSFPEKVWDSVNILVNVPTASRFKSLQVIFIGVNFRVELDSS